MSLSEYYNEKPVYRKMSNGRVRGILALLGSLEGQHILDIGCSAGELGEKLKQGASVFVYGMDISADAVRDARKVLDGAEVYDISTADAFPEAVRREPFTHIVLSEVLEHLLNPVDALKKIRATYACPVVITVPNILFWKNRLKILLGSSEYTKTGLMDEGHIHFFSWRALQDAAREAGYTLTATSHHVPTRGTTALGALFPGLFAYQYIIKITPLLEKKS